ncbi:hypothetical protein PENSUB_9655 [Penicillium subrubescens]|uniref:Uncharacterized protein n=1 Tax=Penicillium subrubescens TaxID=1316194 RepID=A0A1Q5TCX5_9EURO|nr:hypothetical protein PENSUB_9655 [Penicillium subrubescens]
MANNLRPGRRPRPRSILAGSHKVTMANRSARSPRGWTQLYQPQGQPRYSTIQS